MKVCVAGLWHLGTVTAACLAIVSHQVTGYDADESIVQQLQSGEPPLFEPGLKELVQNGLAANQLRFSSDPTAAADADIVWVAYDTPVDDQDQADVSFVTGQVARLLPLLRPGTLVLISSQLPVGTTAALEKQAAGLPIQFAYSPENLRLGNAIRAFMEPGRVVVGIRDNSVKPLVVELLQPITDTIVWMGIESAEMTKHALNAFLATSIVFMNEIAAVCEQVGADALEVEQGLKSEARIGPRAYLRPGGAFAGGTLARDLVFLTETAAVREIAVPLLIGALASNQHHSLWAYQRLRTLLGDLSGKTIALLGLTYKPGTSTLRRSTALELCRLLRADGAQVRALDPQAEPLPPELLDSVTITHSLDEVLAQADAAVVSTEWPEFRAINAEHCQRQMQRALILDPNGFLTSQLGNLPDYYRVGKP